MTRLDDFDGLLRWDALQSWVQARPGIPGHGPVTSVVKLAGGSQNNVFRCMRDGGEFVLRRPPTHPRPNSDETMRREARVLGALAGTEVPHPRLYAACTTTDVLGVCFYVMAAIDGYSPIGGLEGRYATDGDWQRAVAFDLVDSAAALGNVDAAAVGLADLGKADGWVERQVPRWRSQLEGYASFEGWNPDGLAGIDDIASWLDAHRPDRAHIGIIHGDLQWANVMLAKDAPRLAAIVDWELSTLGDPLLDLAWILQAWHEPDDPPGHAGSFDAESMPTRAELVDRYATRTGRDMRHMRWYEVLACYKLGIILEGTHARACAGKAPAEIGAVLHSYTLWLLRYAAHVIERS